MNSSPAPTPHPKVPQPKFQDALGLTRTVMMFLAFSMAYFFSAALRTVTATLAPVLTQEFALQARDLGLLSGGYFLGFALFQIQLGGLLDRFGPKRVIVTMLCIAVLGCAVFATATQFTGLLLARFLCGLGVSVCLMAPLTAYRRWLAPDTQLRANSWMLMAGSLGMLMATLPVQALLPLVGWRGIFWGMGGLVVVAMLCILGSVPTWRTQESQTPLAKTVHAAEVPAQKIANPAALEVSIWRNPYFLRMVPIGFFVYGGFISIQTLWAGPWMTRVAGYSAAQAAGGLFAINLAMLFNYMVWGWINPKLSRSGWDAVRLIRLGLPVSLLALPLAAWVAVDLPLTLSSDVIFHLPIWALWIVYFLASSFVSLAQPAVGLAFPGHMAGRVLTAYNLVIFMGVFSVQWGLGLLIDALLWWGLPVRGAFQGAIGIFWLFCVASYLHFYASKADNPSP